MTIRARAAADLAAVLALSLLGFLAGAHAFRDSPRQQFYQNQFGPAVMVAAGRGFINPLPAPDSDLARFLSGAVEALGPSAGEGERIIPVDQFHVAHRYLLTAVGWWWRVTAIAWPEIAGLVGVLFAASVLTVFGVARLFVPVVPAAIAAAWFATSPLQLGYAPHLRDFAKGAFMLAAAGLAVALVLKPMSLRRAALLGALSGGVIGLGLGFRMDVAIMAPITLTLVALFRGGSPWAAVREKAVIGGLLLAMVATTAWPILSRLSAGGSNAFHVILLGYSDWFDPKLRIEPASYSFVPYYSDEYLRSTLQVYAAQTRGAIVSMPSAAYDAAAVDLWRQWLRHFPADVYTRLLAAVDGVLNLAFEYPAPATESVWRPTQWWSPWFTWLEGWSGWGWAIGLVVLGAAARQGFDRAIFAAVFVIALAGYPSLQYDPRHYFHLQALPICALVIVSWRAAVGLARTLRRVPPATAAVPMSRTILTVAGVAATLLIALVVLRAYQAHHLRAVFAATIDGARQPLDVHFDKHPDGHWIGRWPEADGQPTGFPGLSSAYYLAEFAAAPRDVLTMGFRYAENPGSPPCVLSRYIQSSGGVARFMFPVFGYQDGAFFDGVEIGPNLRRKLIGVYRLSSGGPAGLPLHVQLAGDWQERRLYQRLVAEERLSSDDVGIGVPPAEHCRSEIGIMDAAMSPALAPSVTDVAAVHAGDVRIEPDGVRVDGTANDDASHLVEYRPQTLDEGDTVVSRIWLEAGSLYLALVKDGTWVRNALITKAGVSIVTLRPPEAGQYVILIANGHAGRRPELKFLIDRLGVVRPVRHDGAPQ